MTDATASGPTALILDTNIVLDLLLFGDPVAMALQAQLQAVLTRPAQWRWIATQPMRDELAHVLRYDHLQPRMQHYGRQASGILDAFDQQVTLVDAAPATTLLCRDQDDQKFIDLAIAHRAVLISKDKHVLKMRSRLARFEVTVATAMPD